MAWPLHVVDADGTVYRVGPDENPDGGLLRLVEPDGTIWRQGQSFLAGSIITRILRPADFTATGSYTAEGFPDPVESRIGDADDATRLKFTTDGSITAGFDPPMWYSAFDGSPSSAPDASFHVAEVATHVKAFSHGVGETVTVSTVASVPSAAIGAGSAVFHESVTDEQTSDVMFASTDVDTDVRAGDAVVVAGVSLDGAPEGFITEIWLVVTFTDGPLIGPTAPLSLVDTNGDVLTTLPMILDTA